MTLLEKLEAGSIPEPNSGCLLWCGATNQKGYGRVRWNARTQSAHRLAWLAAYGPIPPGMLVCHKCDVPACINPTHLWLGTNDQNMADMVAKGRSPDGTQTTRGEAHPISKIAESAVRAILADVRPHPAIAADHGITRSMVGKIKRRQSWRHVVVSA